MPIRQTGEKHENIIHDKDDADRRFETGNCQQVKYLERRRMMLLISIILLLNVSGCGSFYKNYLDRKLDPYDEEVKALTARGEINVILLPGCASRPGEQDTLFSCLKLSRDVIPESVKLPAGEKLYLGHISDFILRALKYYQFRERFKDFYGYRIILKFRKLTPAELRSRNFSAYSSIAVGTAGAFAGAATMLPFSGILFLVDGIKTEIDRRDFEKRAARMDLPKPKKNMVVHQLKSGGRTLLHIKDEIDQEVTGYTAARMRFDDKVTSYMVEECILEKVTPEEMNSYQEQIKLFRKEGS
ncbi:MAG: hypothetical protein JW925_05090 [Syntrophaceae bacterium]|nr:hypothetical protein [Syntrophaceae bacterium]